MVENLKGAFVTEAMVWRELLENQAKYDVMNFDLVLMPDEFNEIVKLFKCFKKIRDIKGVAKA